MTVKILTTPASWARINPHGETGRWLPLLRPGLDRIVIVEDDAGEILGQCALIATLNAHGMEIVTAHRGKAAVLRALLDGLGAAAAAAGFASWITSVSRGPMRTMVQRLAARRLPDTFVIKAV